jgi:hypothetical protein
VKWRRCWVQSWFREQWPKRGRDQYRARGARSKGFWGRVGSPLPTAAVRRSGRSRRARDPSFARGFGGHSCTP